MQQLSRFSRISLRVNVDNLELYADPLLEKVFYTLLENALRHGKNIDIEFSYHVLAEGLMVIYRDDGEGVPTAA